MGLQLVVHAVKCMCERSVWFIPIKYQLSLLSTISVKNRTWQCKNCSRMNFQIIWNRVNQQFNVQFLIFVLSIWLPVYTQDMNEHRVSLHLQRFARCGTECRQTPLSTRWLSSQIGISTRSVCRVLEKLHMHPYKVWAIQELKEPDNIQCPHYCLWVCTFVSEWGQAALDKIWSSNEAWFYLSGYINFHNNRY